MKEFRSIPFQRYSDTNAPFFKELSEAATRVIESGWYLRGRETESFEEELAQSCDAPHAVAVSNGLDAIRLLFRAQLELGRLKHGAEIIVPANTYIASLLPLTELGFKPIFAEPLERNFNLDFSQIHRCLTKDTGAVLAVHLYGNPAWDAEVGRGLRENGILVLEDNAQSIGAEASEEGFNGTRKTGNLADGAAFSFYPGKNIGAIGDAGAVVTPDEETADCVRTLANYGSRRKYDHELAGYNNRMDEIQAAMLRIKLRHLQDVCIRRMSNARLYDSLIDNPVIRKPEIIESERQVWHQYVVRVPDRESFRNYLAGRGIETLIHYPSALHKQKCYFPFYGNLSFPIAERLAEEVVSLPIANVSEEDIQYVSDAINDFKL